MADYPPLNKFYTASYAANDRDFPVIAIRLDPRTAGYRVPEDLSPHPDSKRYPNHIFTGAQPSSGDQVVTHVYEILPSPWVPFTRYDDDLGPIQGRRRSVKNEGQIASLAADKRITYEAREGSAIVYTEIEESWSIKVDEDGNSLFPVRDRDFYDASRGPVQERRQLFVPTGEEVGSLENIDGVITQTSYEPYNEFLSFKVIQTYSVDGPQLIGKATNNEGQLTTVTTQRKAADGYTPPSPTATRTIEASREDAESLVERIIDIPEVFAGETFSVERPDPIPQKFRIKIPTQTEQSSLEGIASEPTLSPNDLSKSEQQVTKFVKRQSSTSRDPIVDGVTLQSEVFTSELGGGVATITETISSAPTIDDTTGLVSAEKENLGNDQFLLRQIRLSNLPELKGQNYDDTLDVTIPFTRQFVEAGTEEPLEPSTIEPRDVVHSVTNRIDVEAAKERLLDVLYVTSEIQNIRLPDVLSSAILRVDYDTEFATTNASGNSATASTTIGVSMSVDLDYDIKDGYNGPANAEKFLFFLPKDSCTIPFILSKLNGALAWPTIRAKTERLLLRYSSERKYISLQLSLPNNRSLSQSISKSPSTKIIPIPPTIHPEITITEITTGDSTISGSLGITPPAGSPVGEYLTEIEASAELKPYNTTLPATVPPSFPAGRFLYALSTAPYRFGLVRVEAVVVEVTQAMVA